MKPDQRPKYFTGFPTGWKHSEQKAVPRLIVCPQRTQNMTRLDMMIPGAERVPHLCGRSFTFRRFCQRVDHESTGQVCPVTRTSSLNRDFSNDTVSCAVPFPYVTSNTTEYLVLAGDCETPPYFVI